MLRLGTVIRNHHGFTALEMLISVAIIGLMAALAIPNYMKYSARGKQAEAKTSLANLYASEQIFATDNGSYTTCVSRIMTGGLSNNMHSYTVGFGGSIGIPGGCGFKNAVGGPCNVYDYSTGATCPTVAETVIQATTSAFTYGGSQVIATPTQLMTGGGDLTKTSFLARAMGNIITQSVFDYWSIDSNKRLINEKSGL